MRVQALQEMRDVSGTKVGSAGRIRLQEAAEVLDDWQLVVIVASSAAPASRSRRQGPEADWRFDPALLPDPRELAARTGWRRSGWASPSRNASARWSPTS